MQQLLTLDRLVIITLAAWFVFFYVLNANIYIKKAIGMNTFVRRKPIDCYLCMNFWTASGGLWFLTPTWGAYAFYLSFHTLIAACIQTMVEGAKGND